MFFQALPWHKYWTAAAVVSPEIKVGTGRFFETLQSQTRSDPTLKTDRNRFLFDTRLQIHMYTYVVG